MTNQPTNQANVTTDKPRQDFHPWLVYAICFGISLVFMFFFGLNSPIHTFNSHCDYQWYLTMGRGMVAGKVPYRDLFDHKGPLTYALFAVACWFPHEQFVIWCFEVLCVSLFLYFCYRIARKFLSPWLSLAAIPLMMMVLSTNYARGLEGSCVEEYCWPIFAYGLLCFLDFLMDQRAATWRRSLAIGICLGVLLWTKFTMLEFFLIPMLIWLIINLVHRKFTEILRSGLIMLGGILIVTIPIMIAFAVAGGLQDLYEMYFQLNISSYSGKYEGYENDKTVTSPWHKLLFSFCVGAYVIFAIVWGLICFAVQNWRQKSGWLMLIAVIPTWVMVSFFCGYLYYYLPMFTYAVLGVIYLVKVVARILVAVEATVKRQSMRWVVVLIITVGCFVWSMPFVENLKEINRPREDYAPLVVADIIAEYNRTAEQPATLFCYRMADGGFYYAAGLVPNVRFYAESGFQISDFPEMYESFDETIRSQKCEFVITYPDKYTLNEELFAPYYHPYLGTLEASTIPYVWYEPGGYWESKIVVLLRNGLEYPSSN